MSVMSIRIDDTKRRLLKVIASAEGRSMTDIVGELLDGYIQRKKAVLGDYAQTRDIQSLMKVSESSFAEWDNDEDAVYDDM